MILFDLSQLTWIGVHANFGKNLALTDTPECKNMLRHMLLNSILFYKKKFSSYGQLVICCDSKSYWRRDFFPFYKGDRARKREDNPNVDTAVVHQFVEEFKIELKEYFSYPIIEVEKAEADDIIAVMCKWSQENDLVESMFDSTTKPVMIISEDMDFFQLQKYKNVEQFGPRKQKKLRPECSLHEFNVTHIVKASDDGIPNILSADNCLVDQVRQTSIKQAYLDKFISLGEDACESELEKRNWKRNQTLIDFDFIPATLESQIISAYIGYERKGSKNKVLSYLGKHRCTKLIGELGNF